MNSNLQDVTNFAFRPQCAEQTINALMQSVNRAMAQDLRGYCEYDGPESTWGACDGVRCHRQGEVTHLEYDETGRIWPTLNLCEIHFRLVTK